MLPYWTAPLAAAAGNLLIGLGVLWTERRERVHRVFAFMTLILALWNLDVFCLYFFDDGADALWWSRLFRPGVFFAPAALYHFVTAFRGSRSLRSKSIVVMGYGVGALFVVADFQGAMISGVRQLHSGYWPVMRPLYNGFISVLLVSFVVLLASLVQEFRTTTSPRRRTQARFWLLGAVIALPLASANLLPFFGVNVYPVGSFGNLLCTGIVAYAIVHHRLVDTDIVISKAVAFLAAALLVILPLGALGVWLDRVAYGHVDLDRTLLAVAGLLAAAIGFSSVAGLTEERLARTFFREKAEHRRAVAELSREAARMRPPGELLRRLLEVIRVGMQVETAAVLAADSTGAGYASTGDGDTGRRLAVGADDPLIEVLRGCDDVIVREEIRAAAGRERAAADTLARLGLEVAVPLRANRSLLGCVLIGRTLSGDALSREDLQLLATLGNAAAVALDNARLSDELETSQRLVARASRLSAVGTLAAGVAHEIRNPLVAVQTFLQLLPERLHDDEFVNAFRRLSLGEIGRIGRLIEELLHLTRSPVHAPEPCAVRPLVEDVLTLLEPQARRAGVRFRVTDEGVAPVAADTGRLKQVFMNLLLNAVQASPPGGTVAVTVRSGELTDGRGGCRVEVEDNGPGIPAERRDDVFTPFFTTKDTGSGLGLAVAHQVVTEHGGEITFTSDGETGTTFVVTLPVLEDAACSAHEPHGGEAAEQKNEERHRDQVEVAVQDLLDLAAETKQQDPFDEKAGAS
jgi:signal transduction histidine kinase